MGSLLASLARDRSKAEAVLACRQRPERSGQILLPLSLAISRQGMTTECNSVSGGSLPGAGGVRAGLPVAGCLVRDGLLLRRDAVPGQMGDVEIYTYV